MFFSHWKADALAQINKAYDQSILKRNTTPMLIKRKQTDKDIESTISA